jgi:RNA ligase (TIGR02306 family)
MSTHKVEVVPVVLQPHPNADSLSIVEIWGFTVCVRTQDWRGKDRGAYIPPDSIVDSTRPEFALLAGHEHVKVKKLRGIISMGLLIPTEAEVGEDLMEELGVKHYEPPLSTKEGENTKGPKLYAPNYDVESARRYGHLFNEGESVLVTEKIHGANGRWLFDGEKLHAGSRTSWKQENTNNLWWMALDACPWLKTWLLANPEFVVYGEVFGQVQDLKYGRKLDVAVFDILSGSIWVQADKARELGKELSWVPEIARTEWRWPDITKYAEGQSLIAEHVREGCVIKPLVERTHPEIGRVQAKLIGNGYMERP